MSKSLKISFGADGARLTLDETVEAFDAVVQNGMVNLATEAGSDKGDLERGTTLLRDALQGKIADLLTAQHISNAAAIDTLFYLRNSDETNTEEERVEKISLSPFEYTNEHVRVNVFFSGTQGSTAGREEIL